MMKIKIDTVALIVAFVTGIVFGWFYLHLSACIDAYEAGKNDGRIEAYNVMTNEE